MAPSSHPPLVTAVSSPGEGLVAVAHPSQDHGSSTTMMTTSWRVGLYNVKSGEGHLQTTLTASSSAHPSLSGRIQRLLFVGGGGSDSSSSHCFLAAVSSRCVVVWDLRRGVVAHTIVPAAKKSSTAAGYSIVDAQISTGSSGEASSAVNGRSLYLLVRHGDASIGGNDDEDEDGNDDGGKKLVIWQYDGPRLVRKIKTKGGGGSNASLAVAPGGDGQLWVSCARKVRVHSGGTGRVVRKLSFASPVRAVAPLKACNNGGGGGAYVLLESGEIRWVAAAGDDDDDNDEAKTQQRVVATTTPAQALAGTTSSLSSSWPMLEGCGGAVRDGGADSLLVGGRHLVRVPAAGDGPVPASPVQPLLDAKTVDSGIVRCAGGTTGRDDGAAPALLVAVLYKNGSIQIQSRPHGDANPTPPSGPFGWRDASAAGIAAAAADRSGKRTQEARVGGNPAILGPAQAGGTARHVRESGVPMEVDDDDEGEEAESSEDGGEDENESPPSKKSRADEQQQTDETIGSRLAQLRAQLLADEEEEARQDALALSGGPMTATMAGGDAVTFHPKKATTESLSQLLKQALQDDALLELCLAVSNPAIIRESVAQLPPPDVSALVAAVTSRVAFRPARAEVLCLWLTVLLQTRKASLEVLQPLQNLINDRIELLPALLKLEGRLSLLSPSVE